MYNAHTPSSARPQRRGGVSLGQALGLLSGEDDDDDGIGPGIIRVTGGSVLGGGGGSILGGSGILGSGVRSRSSNEDDESSSSFLRISLLSSPESSRDRIAFTKEF